MGQSVKCPNSLIFLNVYLFLTERERERERMSRGGAERERERESQAGFTLSVWNPLIARS